MKLNITARDGSLDERAVRGLPARLEALRPRACAMSAAALRAYRGYMATPDATVRGIVETIAATPPALLRLDGSRGS